MGQKPTSPHRGFTSSGFEDGASVSDSVAVSIIVTETKEKRPLGDLNGTFRLIISENITIHHPLHCFQIFVDPPPLLLSSSLFLTDNLLSYNVCSLLNISLG
ncbi:hypothetical protein RJT34_03026 [Clitoria ternatea]|uniref:Uncharacterized protein n=1 Tax=Clitoria ternatea TaxID=43366 RepID=A0AAN9KJ15_CLITE